MKFLSRFLCFLSPFVFAVSGHLKAEELPLLTLDSLADIYYNAETGDPVVSDTIKALDGQRVRIAGYMVPFNDLENLKEFMLMPSSNGCNFCESPALEEMIYVRQPGKKKYPFMQAPIVVTGTLWIKGGTTKPKNSTYAQFLYALNDTKIESLTPEHLELVEKVTPRAILKQVCSLLRVRLTKPVTFQQLGVEAWTRQRTTLLTKYLGGDAGVAQLQTFLDAFEIPHSDDLLSLASTYLSNWSGAYTNESGTEISYRDDLDLSTLEHQLQIAMACYELLFQQEINIHQVLHRAPHTFDETLARLSLLLGLRQSFSQFYGSIGLIDLRPVIDFRPPFTEIDELPAPYLSLVDQLLVGQESFIKNVYDCEKFQPYTKAISAPPVTMAQILDPTLYTETKEPYERPQLADYPNRLGTYLTELLLNDSALARGLIRDGLRFQTSHDWQTTFEWKAEWSDEQTAQSAVKALNTFSKLNTSISGNITTVTHKSTTH